MFIIYSPYSSSYNLTPAISRGLIGRQLIIFLPTWPTCCSWPRKCTPVLKQLTGGRVFHSSGKKLFILVNNQKYIVIVISLDWSSFRDYFYTYILREKLIPCNVFNLFSTYSNFNTLSNTYCQKRKNLERWEFNLLLPNSIYYR